LIVRRHRYTLMCSHTSVKPDNKNLSNKLSPSIELPIVSLDVIISSS